MEPNRLLVYVLLFCAAVAAIAGWSWLEARRASRSWRPTRGRIVEASLETDPGSDPDRSGTRYYPRIHYEYEVDGTTYRGHCWKVGETFVKRYLTERQGRAVLARYREGREVTVYYDPADPGESALERA